MVWRLYPCDSRRRGGAFARWGLAAAIAVLAAGLTASAWDSVGYFCRGGVVCCSSGYFYVCVFTPLGAKPWKGGWHRLPLGYSHSAPGKGTVFVSTAPQLGWAPVYLRSASRDGQTCLYQCGVPLWIPLAACVWLAVRAWRPVAPSSSAVCHQCEYSRVGLRDGWACQECGSFVAGCNESA